MIKKKIALNKEDVISGSVWTTVKILTHHLFSTSCSFFQGYAYTFITEDQVRYAGDIIKALELSGSTVPPELEQLWASFKDQQKAVR